jgi:elongation factor Ts
MAGITATMVNDLRRMTGLGLMECKSLLQEAGGEMEKAVTLAKERGLKHAEKRAGRAAKAGRVEVVLSGDGKSGAMVELNCETDFVARNDDFKAVARELAEFVLAGGKGELNAVLESKMPKHGKSVKDVLIDVNARTGENVGLSRVACFSGAGRVDAYVHHDGMKGALVQMSGDAEPALVRELAMHIVATPIKPVAVRREEVAAPLVEEQKRIYLAQIAQQMADKPERVREKIATGKMDAWFKEVVLLEQEFIKDPGKKIKDMLGAAGKVLTVKQFARFVVGEGDEMAG